MADFSVMQPNRLENAPVMKSLPSVAFGHTPGAASGMSDRDYVRSNIDDAAAGPEATPPLTANRSGEQNPADMNRDVEDATRTRQVEELNALLEKRQSYLRFEEDKGSERMVIFIKNGETGEVIRQIPSPEFLAMSENLKRFLEMDGSSARMAVPPGLLTYETA